jgi:hypothetical protein
MSKSDYNQHATFEAASENSALIVTEDPCTYDELYLFVVYLIMLSVIETI